MEDNATEHGRKTKKRKHHDDSSQTVSDEGTTAKLKKSDKRHKNDKRNDSSHLHGENDISQTINLDELCHKHDKSKENKHKIATIHSEVVTNTETMIGTNTTHVQEHSKTDNENTINKGKQSLKHLKNMNKTHSKTDRRVSKPVSQLKTKVTDYDEHKSNLSTETKLQQKLAGIHKTSNVFRMEDSVEKDGSNDGSVDPEKDEIRKKKREKRKQKKLNKLKLTEGSGEKSGAVRDSALQYLHQWDTERSQWKFQKVRQVWLLQNMFSQERVSDADFDILLRYLQELKGKSRETTVANAEEVLKQVEDGAENTETYKEERTRSVIQLLC